MALNNGISQAGKLVGESLVETIHGGDGDDLLVRRSNVVIHAGTGDDVVSVFDHCTVDGGAGSDRLEIGGSAAVLTYGGLGADLIFATGTVYTDDGDASTPAEGGDRVVVSDRALIPWTETVCHVQDFQPGEGGDVLSLARLLPSLEALDGLAAFNGINLLLDRARLALDGARVVQSGPGMLGGDSWLRLLEADGAVQVQLDTTSGRGIYRTVAVLHGVSLAQLAPANFEPPIDFGGAAAAGGAGSDRIEITSGLVGANRITTGAGADVVVLESWLWPDARATVVTDFKAGSGGDLIDLKALFPNSHDDPFAAGLLRLTATAGDTRVELDADGGANGANFQTMLVLKGVAPGSLTGDNFVQPVQPVLADNPHMPRAQASKTLVLAEDAEPVALGLGVPTDPDGGTPAIRLWGLPSQGQVLLDGQPLSWWSNRSLTAAELTRLEFLADPDASGPLGSFTYLVTDDEGSTIQRSVHFEATPVDDAPLLVAQPSSGKALSAADLFIF